LKKNRNLNYFLILFTLLSFEIGGQTNLSFDKRFVECEDHWVAFNMNKDSSYTYGFIYIDEEAGLTFNREGNFNFNKNNALSIEKFKGTNIKIRLQPNKVKVAIIPETMFSELQIDKQPEWLKSYKKDTNSIERLYKWGYMYNGWNECSKALSYLLKAREINPKYEGLSVELAFSYNCLKDYGKAEEILEEELVLNPTDAYVNKEYIYTISKTDQIEKAVNQYNNSLQSIEDKTYHAENCFNIMQYYYNKRDVKNFNVWYKKLNEYKNTNEVISDYAKRMKKELKE
jgi:tetratricopeptide (TPR) repeat protein